jgi:hypothetical protein
MSKITDFMRKIGLLHVSKGDSVTGEFDSREDLKQPEEKKEPEQQETQGDSGQQQETQEAPEEPKQQM